MILDIAIIAFLMIVAIALVLLEIFLFPGITLAGVGGFLFAIGGAVFAYSVGTTVGHVALVSSVVVFVIAFAWLMRSGSFSRVALKTNIDSRLTSSRELGICPGDEGITLSRLAPIGKARVNGLTVEAKSEGELIDENRPIVVVRVDSYNVIVRLKENQE